MAHLLANGDPSARESTSRPVESPRPSYARFPKIAQSPWEIKLLPDSPCKCECRLGEAIQTVFQTRYRSVLVFRTNAACDETEHEPLLQFGSELWLDGKLTLRQETCRETGKEIFLGRNEGVFRFHRYRPNQDVVKNCFCGTEGVLPLEKGAAKCCGIGHGLGTYHGRGFNKLEGWSVCASYHSVIEGLNAVSLCKEGSLKVSIDIDGFIIGPCGSIDKSK